MKKFVTSLIFAILLTFSGISQTSQGSHTIFANDTTPTVNGYMSLDGSMTWVNGYPCGSMGGSIGLTVNHCFSIGGAGEFLFDSGADPDENVCIPPEYQWIKMYQIRKYSWYGGLTMEVTMFPKFPIHVTFPALIGGGGTTYKLQEDNELWCPYAIDIYHKYFFIATIGARAEFNVVNGIRISCGPSYRYVTNTNSFTGLSIDLSVKFGRY